MGHHYVPQAVYGDAGIEGEALEVFKNAVTGQTEPNHDFSNGHPDYNKAVKEKLNDYMKANNIDPKHMSKQQAKDFVTIVKKSKDPRISNFLTYVHKARRAYMAKMAREAAEKGVKRLGGSAARKVPVVTIGLFAVDWYRGGFKHAVNETAWPIPVFKEEN